MRRFNILALKNQTNKIICLYFDITVI